MSTSTARITNEHRQQFREEGYFIVEDVITPEHLALLRDTCDALIGETDAQIDRGEWHLVREITHKGKRYFIDGAYARRPDLGSYLFSDYMADICRATIGPNAYLFKNQFVVKCAEVGMKFGWHQDSGYIPEPHSPYLSCWCALEDVTEERGTIYVLPWSRAGGNQIREHVREEDTNDLIGYFGDDPGVPVVVRAGGIAVFSSTSFHRSGANQSNQTRRAYLAQYSPKIMSSKEGTTRQAVPFLREGRSVRPIQPPDKSSSQ